MKKIFILFVLAFFSIAAFSQKNNSLVDGDTPINSLVDGDSPVGLFKDKNWKLIANHQISFVNKLIEKKIDINSINFENKAELAKILDMSVKTYDSKQKELKKAAQALIKKYKLKKECEPCKASSAERSKNAKIILQKAIKNPEGLKKFLTEVKPKQSNDKVEEIKPCCDQLAMLSCVTAAIVVTGGPENPACELLITICFSMYWSCC